MCPTARHPAAEREHGAPATERMTQNGGTRGGGAGGSGSGGLRLYDSQNSGYSGSDPLATDQATTEPPYEVPAGNPEEKPAPVTAAMVATAKAAAEVAVTVVAAAATVAPAAATAAMIMQGNEAEEATGAAAVAAGSAAMPAEAATANTNPDLSPPKYCSTRFNFILLFHMCACHSIS
jgi:hypothetical protein